MKYILNTKRNMKNIIILILLFTFVKLDNTIQELNIENLEIAYEEATNFHFSPKSEIIPNNIKIQVNGKQNTTNYVISYYKDDSSFKDRNQLSQSLSGKAFMWLNKEQIKDGFYLSVECSELKCEYSLNITLKEKIEVNLGEPYSYYVTKENKNSEIIITGNPFDFPAFYYKYNCKVTIWAKGNKNINTELKVESFEKHPKYNAYLILLPEPTVLNYSLFINATEGDLINVGALFFDGYNICPILFKDLGLEISPLFVKGMLEDAYFFFPKNSNLTHTLYHFDYETENSEFLNDEYSYIQLYTQVFMRVDPYNSYTFFSLQYIEYSNNVTKESHKINHFPPQILGNTYERNIKKNEIISLIPMKPENDFNYLTYHIATRDGLFKSYIYKCENYPLCKLDKELLKNEDKLIDFNSASISYNKTEYSENLSPISKSQKMLVILCESEECKLLTSMYTNKEDLNILLSVPYYKYLRENNEDSYLMKLNKAIKNSLSIIPGDLSIYINIELISGDINLAPEENEDFKENTKKLIAFKIDTINNFRLKVKANSNSVYSISASLHTGQYDLLTPQINYLLKIDNSLKENTLIFADEYLTSNKYYFGFFSQNCNIGVKYSSSQYVPVNDFYQDYQTIDDKFKSIQYKVINNDKDKSNCFFGASMYNINDKNSNSIILSKENTYSFMFNKLNNNNKFTYLNSEKEKDLLIDLQLLGEAIYSMTLYINENKYQEYSLSKSLLITLKSSNILALCENDDQPCKFNLLLNSGSEDDSTIKITISHNITDDSEHEEEKEEEESHHKEEEQKEE